MDDVTASFASALEHGLFLESGHQCEECGGRVVFPRTIVQGRCPSCAAECGDFSPAWVVVLPNGSRVGGWPAQMRWGAEEFAAIHGGSVEQA